MNKLLPKTLIFAAGVVIGSVATWAVIKDKYAQIAQEEIDSVKEVFSRREKGESESRKFAMMGEAVAEGFEAGVEAAEKKEYERYASVYATANKMASVVKDGKTKSALEMGVDPNFKLEVEEETDDVERPYVIPPEEFGELDYETVSLTYYEDGVLTDDMDNVIEDLDDIIGEESLKHFGEYEDDSVFVRNDARETDYEILMDTRKFSDIYPDHP